LLSASKLNSPRASAPVDGRRIERSVGLGRRRLRRRIRIQHSFISEPVELVALPDVSDSLQNPDWERIVPASSLKNHKDGRGSIPTRVHGRKQRNRANDDRKSPAFSAIDGLPARSTVNAWTRSRLTPLPARRNRVVGIGSEVSIYDNLSWHGLLLQD